MPWGTDSGAVDLLLHALFVAERQRLLDRHARQSERLTDPRSEDHVRLPQTLDLIDRRVLGEPVKRGKHAAFVGEGHLFVVCEGIPCRLRERRRRLIAEADDCGTHSRQCPGEVGHLCRITGRDHHNVHCASTSSIRSRVMMRCRASWTTSVSGCLTMTYPSPS